MSPGRWMVVGASGLVGAEVVRRARAQGRQVAGFARTAQGEARLPLDLTDRAAVERAVAEHSPEVLFLCSAWPHVDGCEADPERSWRENVGTVRNVIAATVGSGAQLVFFSSDHVLGSSPEPQPESAPPAPVSVYARHKREVEELLLARGDSLIARTAWVFGPELRRKNFVYRVIELARGGQALRVPEGQRGCPTFAGWLAASTLALLEQGLEGLVHLSGSEPHSKAQWAARIVHELGLPPVQITEVPWREAGQLAPRPDCVVLRSERHALVHPPLSEILSAEAARLLQ
jgi:dTDP-4-dehydrorhamnose reductase